MCHVVDLVMGNHCVSVKRISKLHTRTHEKCFFAAIPWKTSFCIFAGHAPHSGYLRDQRDQWWEEPHRLFQQHLDHEPLILLMDANASPGQRDDIVVFQDGFATSATNTPAFRDHLSTWNLYLPTTSPAHSGTHSTWTSVDGRTEHCIDHVALPQHWHDRCTMSRVLQDFDMATTHDDHSAVAVQVEWQETIAMRVAERTPSICRARVQYRSSQKVHQIIANIPVAPWTTDVETQAHQLHSEEMAVNDIPSTSPTLMHGFGNYDKKGLLSKRVSNELTSNLLDN